MAFCVESILRRISANTVRKLSTVAEPVRIQEESLQIFRTSENNPENHTRDHLKRFYTVPDNERNVIFPIGAVPKLFDADAKTFNEFCIMVRQPALEIISYLQQTDYTKPVNKYVLFGETGTGKTTSLLHLIHYGYMSKHILVHIPWIQNWYRFPKEYSNSTSREGLMDVPIESATWLAHFRIQNRNLLTILDLRTTKDYVWSQRETSPKGIPFLELIDFGIKRIKFASEVLAALLQELKQASIAAKCKTMVIIDGYNAVFSNHSRIRDDNKKFVPASQVTVTQPFIDITKTDWNHAVIILTVDKWAAKETKDSTLPRYLLQTKGFEHLDPFIPVKTDNYDEGEFEMIIEYYKDRKWIRDMTPKGQRELQLLTNGNPRKLTQICAGL